MLPICSYALDVTVEVNGLDRDLKANTLTFLSVEQERQRETLTPSRLRLLHRKAEAEIRKALQPFGYFKPLVDARLEEDGQRYTVIYEVEPGPQVRLAEVDFQVLGEGKDDPLLKLLFPMAVGDVLDQTVYEKAKQELQSETLENGYLDAHYILHQLRVDLDSYTASIQLHLDTGAHFAFGEVRFIQDVMKPEFLARYLQFKPGDPFSHKKLLSLQSNLFSSQYFRNVEVTTLRDQAEGNQVPIEVQLTPNKRDRYRIGPGFSTDTGPRLTLDWMRRRVGSSGHRLQSKLRLSQPRSTFQTEYMIPLERPSKDSLSFGFSVDRYDTDSRKGLLTLVNAEHSVGLENGWRRSFGVDYSYETYEVSEQDEADILLVPNAQLTRLKTDGLDFSQRGHALDFRIEGSYESPLSNVSYLQFSTSDKLIHGFGDGDWRLLARVDLGATLVDELTDLPASKRYFAGGDNSVRGFDLDELGPKDEEGEVVGGRFLAVGSLELERRIVGKWSAAVFFDAGNAYDPNYDSELEYSAGLGVRWRSPVGPVRVDVASGLSEADTGLRLHIVVGPEL